MTIQWIWIASAILCAGSAQLGLRVIARYEIGSAPWLAGIAVSIGFYVLSFAAYSFVLRHYRISQAGPMMTLGVVMLVVLGGTMLGETLTPGQWTGLLFALIAVWLLMG